MKKNVPSTSLFKRIVSLANPAIALLLLSHVSPLQAGAQTFVHPGGLHTQADLDRMKTKVAAGAHPWIDDWNVLITDWQAQNTYGATAQADISANRQQASRDAHAAYLNTIRWYISGDASYADCAVRICNAWSSAVNVIPGGQLFQLPIYDFTKVGELLRVYSGWAPADFARFQNMMLTYFYPPCHDFLLNHLGTCASYLTASWDAPAMGSVMNIGILCDDTAKFNEAVTYYKNGIGNGNITNAVWASQAGNLGQVAEMGRDQEHAILGIANLAEVCQSAWNQGVDLYGYANNRLLAGFEYIAQYNLWHPVPYTPYNNCVNDDWLYVATNGRGRLDRPVYEMVYNHYAVLQGISAPNTKATAQLMRPEGGNGDHFGYGTLTFTLDAAASPYPPLPAPATPTGLTATAGVSQLSLSWTAPAGDVAQGYTVQRSTTSGGPYTTLTSLNANTATEYIDATVTNGTTYYYVVAATNQSGMSSYSAQAGAKSVASGALPAGWSNQDIGNVSAAGSASYAGAGNNTFLVNGAGSDIGGSSDSYNYTYRKVTGDVILTTRLSNVSGTLWKSGIVFRESLDPGAKTQVMKLGDVGFREAHFGTRATTGGSMTWVSGDQFTWVPVWLKVQRSGNSFTGFQSSDGVTWFSIGASTVTMDSSYYVGLAACSGSTTGALNNSTFDNMTLTGASIADTASASLGGITIYPNPVQDQLTVKLANEFQKGATITLYDATGRIVIRTPVTGVLYILNCSAISRGTYIMVISNGVVSVAKKVVKQ
ncbi:MAG TPA: T9SS type A sorting domain-containing protein [Puia sp.]|nr:T9SS type A sorting domain-containing protein [Puia sp.]